MPRPDRAAGVALALLAGCGTATSPESPIPNVSGLSVLDLGRPTNDAATRLADVTGDPVEAYGAVELAVDIAPAAGTESVLAGTRKLVILDARGRTIARAGGRATGGSADEILLAARADARIGDVPMIAVLSTIGGRREAETWFELYAFDPQRLVRAFEAVTERRVDGEVTTGSLSFAGGTIDYRPPGGRAVRRFSYDAASMTFTQCP